MLHVSDCLQPGGFICVHFICRKGHKLISSVFGLSSTLRIPLPIPLLKQRELRCYTLSYDNKSENFTTILNDKLLADVVFICRQNEYYCHKIILCSRVKLFRRLFGMCLDNDSMSVKFTDKASSLNTEVLYATSLFEEASIVHHSDHW